MGPIPLLLKNELQLIRWVQNNVYRKASAFLMAIRICILNQHGTQITISRYVKVPIDTEQFDMTNLDLNCVLGF